MRCQNGAELPKSRGSTIPSTAPTTLNHCCFFVEHKKLPGKTDTLYVCMRHNSPRSLASPSIDDSL